MVSSISSSLEMIDAAEMELNEIARELSSIEDPIRDLAAVQLDATDASLPFSVGQSLPSNAILSIAFGSSPAIVADIRHFETKLANPLFIGLQKQDVRSRIKADDLELPMIVMINAKAVPIPIVTGEASQAKLEKAVEKMDKMLEDSAATVAKAKRVFDDMTEKAFQAQEEGGKVYEKLQKTADAAGEKLKIIMDQRQQIEDEIMKRLDRFKRAFSR